MAYMAACKLGTQSAVSGMWEGGGGGVGTVPVGMFEKAGSQTELQKKVRCHNVLLSKPIMIIMEDRNEVPGQG